MINQYQIQPNSKRCVVSGRELLPGERFYSALVAEGSNLQRQDFSPEAWQGPPEGAFGFWTGLVPTPHDSHKPQFDDELLEECFHRLEGQTDTGRVNFRYVVALLLIRRKRFKLEGSGREGEHETLKILSLRDGTKHTLINPTLTEDEMQQVQEEVFRVLGWK